ncbi:unnamed protein product [Parnassius apollo]|uniref:(apollo) hypothetical protein n=1 Tax=Parnassius apollo TaxID=110799 RepID=A0A8S3WFF4_PARAO|nr:unnamed protein product [Parnassius apollo]
MSATKIAFCACLLIQNIYGQSIGATLNKGLQGNGIATATPLTAANPLTTANNIATANNLAVASNIAATEALSTPLVNLLGYEKKLGGLKIDEIMASNGRGFQVTSSSPVAPHGLSVFSENLVAEGPLVVTGELPFLSSVSVEGQLQATGQGAVSYGCGNGNVGITNEGTGPSGPVGSMPYGGPMGQGFGLNGYGYNNLVSSIPNEVAAAAIGGQTVL